MTFNATIFLDKERIADDLLNNLTDEDKKAFAHTPKNNIIRYHLNFGMWIRNTYSMWDPNNPYTDPNDPEGPTHPDQYSYAVMELLHGRLQKWINKSSSPV